MTTDINLLGGLIGGLLIGLSALLLLASNGKIAGISGICGQLFLNSQERLWRACFMLGLLAGAAIIYWSGLIPDIQMQSNKLGLIIAGLLVGIGTKLGSGCTSGHGVCGLARRSPRSLAALLTFMLTAAVTASLVHGVLQ